MRRPFLREPPQQLVLRDDALGDEQLYQRAVWTRLGTDSS